MKEEIKHAEEGNKKIKIQFPEPPPDFDKSKYKDELERYDPHNVAELMYSRKERKIPGSVLKPHSPYVCLVQSNALRTQMKQVRVLFPYPQYCHRLKTQESFLRHPDLLHQTLQDQEIQLKIVHNYKMI